MKFIKHRPFKAKVKVEFPSADGEGIDAQEFMAKFVAIPMDELGAIPMGTIEEQEAYLRRVFVGWEGLTDDTNGKDAPFEFSEENHNFLIRDFYIRRAVMDTYAAQITGAKRGN